MATQTTPAATATRVSWAMEADYLQACNCDYGCPCEFEAPPTKGFCEGVGAWRITKGNYGSVRLDGLGFGFAARWPGALHQGNGTAALFFDERADAQQREALLQIASGKAGGMPFEIIAAIMMAHIAKSAQRSPTPHAPRSGALIAMPIAAHGMARAW